MLPRNKDIKNCDPIAERKELQQAVWAYFDKWEYRRRRELIRLILEIYPTALMVSILSTINGDIFIDKTTVKRLASRAVKVKMFIISPRLYLIINMPLGQFIKSCEWGILDDVLADVEELCNVSDIRRITNVRRTMSALTRLKEDKSNCYFRKQEILFNQLHEFKISFLNARIGQKATQLERALPIEEQPLGVPFVDHL